MRRISLFLLALTLLTSCGQSYEETKRLSREQQRKLWRADSAALKVAVLPTLDCLPLYVAREHGMFDTTVVDVRLKPFTAQMDCDTAFVGGSVEGMVSDLVRTERIRQQGTAVRYVSATNAYWQLLTNRTARIKELKGLDDRMLAMTRYSATDLLGDLAVDSARLKPERVFRIQVNDVFIRLRMLQNNEMDALLLTEPQATVARQGRHPVLLDSRQLGLHLGVLAFREQALKDESRQRQLDALISGYNRACDSINKYGTRAYADIIMRYCQVKRETVDSLPAGLKFPRVAAPADADVERARQWLGAGGSKSESSRGGTAKKAQGGAKKKK